MANKKEDDRKQIESALIKREFKSQFLEEYFESNDNVVSYDPRDPFGRKLPGWKCVYYIINEDLGIQY